ncbi:hypothetical protein VDGL01_00704 [Verticillium dahliae]
MRVGGKAEHHGLDAKTQKRAKYAKQTPFHPDHGKKGPVWSDAVPRDSQQYACWRLITGSPNWVQGLSRQMGQWGGCTDAARRDLVEVGGPSRKMFRSSGRHGAVGSTVIAPPILFGCWRPPGVN